MTISVWRQKRKPEDGLFIPMIEYLFETLDEKGRPGGWFIGFVVSLTLGVLVFIGDFVL
jgi:hypothetical protein